MGVIIVVDVFGVGGGVFLGIAGAVAVVGLVAVVGINCIVCYLAHSGVATLLLFFHYFFLVVMW